MSALKIEQPQVEAALHAATAALYFADNSDYETALWQVVGALCPAMRELLDEQPGVAYRMTRRWAAAADSRKASDVNRTAFDSSAWVGALAVTLEREAAECSKSAANPGDYGTSFHVLSIVLARLAIDFRKQMESAPTKQLSDP